MTAGTAGATESDVDGLVADLSAAASALDDARAAVEEIGPDAAAATADALERAEGLLARYEDSATGSGDFQAYVEFRSEFDDLVDGLDEDLPRHDAFEEAQERLDKRRLSVSDFEAVRDLLGPARAVADRLDERDEARKRYRDARYDVRQARDRRADRVDRLERLLELGEADIDAPVEDLREPVAAYDDAVREAFESFKRSAPAREVLELVAEAAAYPLVDFRDPPERLREYVAGHDAGEEPIPTLVEYADYSRSKLDHYVADVDALKRTVATNQTYLRRLDAGPLTLGFPPPTADELRWRARELESVVARFASDDVLADLREVRELARGEEYARLREAAVARDELGDAQRERLLAGEVEPELERVRAEKRRLDDALEEYPEQ